MRGDAIYLVANKVSQQHCRNLVSSIRLAGCLLPIKLIPFGGDAVDDRALLSEVILTPEHKFPQAAHLLVERLARTLTACPRGYLLRFFALFGEETRFLYSDNDIVALSNWTYLFQEFERHDAPRIVHADEEYTTEGRFNFRNPSAIIAAFGPDALSSAVTAGHFLCSDKNALAEGLVSACDWIDANPGVAIPHDQSAFHIAVLIGRLKVRNLCRDASWGSSWAGDWANTLALIHFCRRGGQISHLHFSGSTPNGTKPIDVLLFANLSSTRWIVHMFRDSTKQLTGYNWLCWAVQRLRKRMSI